MRHRLTEIQMAHTQKRVLQLARIMHQITGIDPLMKNAQKNRSKMRAMICYRMEFEGHSRYRVARVYGCLKCTLTLNVLELEARLHQPEVYKAYHDLWSEFSRRASLTAWQRATTPSPETLKRQKRRYY